MNPSISTDDGSPAADGAAGPDLTGKTLGDYRVLRRLGLGGMGQVYLAEQISLKRNVALKILRPDLAANPTSLARFKAEAEAVAKVTHANIIQVYAVGELQGQPYIALEYVEGRNLKEFVAKKGPPELLLALSIMRQTAAALQRASEAGIVHRDIKPENILLTRKGEVKVADFGLSRCLDNDKPLHLTQSGVTMGTPLYMSPEQVEGKPLDARTDIYSLGVTSFFMLAGQPPFDGATAFEVAMKHARDEPPALASIRPDLPELLCTAVHKMLAKDPAQRYQTGRELIRDLARVREGLSGQTIYAARNAFAAEPPTASPSPPTPLPRSGGEGRGTTTGMMVRPSRRIVWIAVFALSLVAAVALGGAAAWLRRPTAQAPPPAPANAEADDAADDLPLNDEELHKVLDKYLRSVKSEDVPVGMGLCLELGTRYLDQHRLDDAEKLFEKLEGMQTVRQYQLLGQLGRAIVLALRDQADESNRRFRDIFPEQGAKDLQKRLGRMYTSAPFRFWLAQAVSYNHANGVADKDVPPGLKQLAETPPRPHP
ncbi:MAG TPA: serine/threonine-protein kinase [Gemmataceae bacterium]|nr:serine/threonine-protein kinase [Gemmataceae bacterium]